MLCEGAGRPCCVLRCATLVRKADTRHSAAAIESNPNILTARVPGIPFAAHGARMSARHAYFFKGARYLRYDIDTDAVDVGPTEISRFWTALPEEFRSGLNAVVNWGDGHA